MSRPGQSYEMQQRLPAQRRAEQSVSGMAERFKSEWGTIEGCSTWATLVWRPCPISTPPWVTRTVPSVYTCTRAPAWFRNLVVKEMPNLVGMTAKPRLRHLLALLNLSHAFCRSANPACSMTPSQQACSQQKMNKACERQTGARKAKSTEL